MIGMDVQVGSGEIEKLLGMLHVSKEACRRASKRAVRKVAKWTQATAAKTMSAEMRLQQRIMRARLRMYMRGDGMEQKVWLGLNSLAARRLGVPKSKEREQRSAPISRRRIPNLEVWWRRLPQNNVRAVPARACQAGNRRCRRQGTARTHHAAQKPGCSRYCGRNSTMNFRSPWGAQNDTHRHRRRNRCQAPCSNARRPNYRRRPAAACAAIHPRSCGLY